MSTENTEKKELTKEQMEKAKGGITNTTARKYTGTPHCRLCKTEAKPFGAFYRCPLAGCKEQGQNKTPAEVDWY